ncbi:hypothetical protein [Lacinutrix jangbogonensis]|uniref:hypothetical protein n=1 Tax=Lacinutrix jangbogonensis TaxID=1469557 RepID=UPI00053EA5BE|nr:hypothetical protein [Lacinutrix jangbogonensis]
MATDIKTISGKVYTDGIEEETLDNGVEIDGVILKDDSVTATNFIGDGSMLTNLPVSADDQTAAEVPSTVTGGIEATNVDAAIAELEAEKAPLASPTFTGNVTASSLVSSEYPAGNYLRFVSNNCTQLSGATFLGLKINNADKLVVLSDKIYSTVPIGIGSTSPSADLDIVGSFQYEDGNEAVGKVLTSDVDGNATWETPIAGSGNQTAAEVPSTVTGGIEATNVDAAIAELEAEKAPLSLVISAQATADNAEALANQADSAASSAQSLANSAYGEAQQAQSQASSAYGSAQQA